MMEKFLLIATIVGVIWFAVVIFIVLALAVMALEDWVMKQAEKKGKQVQNTETEHKQLTTDPAFPSFFEDLEAFRRDIQL